MKRHTITLLFVALLLVPIFPTPAANATQTASSTEVPTPIFVGIDPQLNFYSKGAEITITYKVPRDSVDGIKLLGEGPEFTTNLTAALNLTKDYDERAYSFYTATFKLNFTVTVWAWAWIDNVSNGESELPNIDPVLHTYQGHPLYVADDDKAPVLALISGAGETGDGLQTPLYTPYGSNVTITYLVDDQEPANTTPTFAFSFNDTSLSNTTETDLSDVYFVEMTLIRVRPEDQKAEYAVGLIFNKENITIGSNVFPGDVRRVYFTANNSAGWEHLGYEPRVHGLYNGFSFSSAVKAPSVMDTEIVNVTVTSQNATVADSFGLYYRVLESETNDTAILNWTLIQDTDPSFNLVNHSIVNNTDVSTENRTATIVLDEYNVTLGYFDAGRKIEFKATNWYMGKQYNETSGYHVLIIANSTPVLSLRPENGTYFNNEDREITFEYHNEVPEGKNFTYVLLTFGDGDEELVNYTANDPITHNATHTYDADGTYTVVLTVETTYNVTHSINVTITIDTVNPVVTITEPTVTELQIETKTFTIAFNATDSLSGVELLLVHWGDGLVENFTGLSEASHTYLHDGEYTIVVEAIDKAGNSNTVEFLLVVNTGEGVTSSPSPFSLFWLLSLFVIVPVLRRRR